MYYPVWPMAVFGLPTNKVKSCLCMLDKKNRTSLMQVGIEDDFKSLKKKKKS